jgi:acyl-CoA hydrolase
MPDLSARLAPVVVMTDIVFPEDVNPYGTMFGGKVMAMMDKAAYLAAVRFARIAFVTISSDDIQFLEPLAKGDVIEVRARVALAGRTSVVAKVEVIVEHPFTGDRRVCTRGWFAMAARDDRNRPARVPGLELPTEELRADHDHADEFRQRSIERRARHAQPED